MALSCSRDAGIWTSVLIVSVLNSLEIRDSLVMKGCRSRGERKR